jgi:hypothetical protein
MAPSRAGDVSHSPGRVADSLQWNWVSSCRAQIGRSLKFCVHAIWQVQDISDAWSIHSAVLCITSLLFPSGRKEAREREKKNEKTAFQWVNQQLCWSHGRTFQAGMYSKKLF